MNKLLKYIKTALIFTAILGLLFTANCSDSEDRSLVSTFMAFRPNVIYVYENPADPEGTQMMFFDHIAGQIAQRTLFAAATSVTEVLVVNDEMYLARFIDTNVNQGNFLSEPLTDVDVIIQGPLSVGKTWRSNVDGRTGDFSRVESLNERVRVPYGTFRCLVVRTTYDRTAVVSYYAPGIGLVRIVRETLREDGETARQEMVLSQIIENVGIETMLEVYFPINGEIESTAVNVTRYTNEDAMAVYINAANEIWANVAGFTLDPVWLNEIHVLDFREERQSFPRFDFNGGLIEAMNRLPNLEAEELMLFSIAATLSPIFVHNPCRHPEHTHQRFNPSEAIITVNGRAYISDRWERAIEDRIVVFAYDDDDEPQFSWDDMFHE
jgi:hypothetical protein